MLGHAWGASARAAPDLLPSVRRSYPMFEYTLQQAWAPVGGAQPSAAEWFERYGTRRYGQTEPSAVKAWELLGSTIYTGQGGGDPHEHSCALGCVSPSFCEADLLLADRIRRPGLGGHDARPAARTARAAAGRPRRASRLHAPPPEGWLLEPSAGADRADDRG